MQEGGKHCWFTPYSSCTWA